MIKDSKNLRQRQLLLNGLGLVAPLVAAFFAIPILLSDLGPTKFGLLTLFWAIIGYSNIFEFGLGRSITKLLAMDIGAQPSQSKIVASGFVICILLGAFGCAVAYFFFPHIFEDLVNVPIELAQDVERSGKIVALAMPALIAMPILFGILEAHRLFGFISFIRIPTGAALFAVPAIISFYSDDVSDLVLGMLAVRVASVGILAFFVFRLVDLRKRDFRFDLGYAKELLTFGGWLTVSMVLGPVLVYADRFLLASYQTLVETASYTTPFEAIVRFLVLPAAVVGVMFPRFVANFNSGERNQVNLYREANIYVFGVVAPITLVVLLFSDHLFAYWLAKEDVSDIAFIARILSVALLINAVAHVPQAFIQATGRANWTGKLHIFEMALWLFYMPFLISRFGAEGAAIGWLFRVIVSAGFLYFLVAIIFKRSNNTKAIK